MGFQTTDVLTDISNTLEVDVSDGVVIYQYDDHGGFLGYGHYAPRRLKQLARHAGYVVFG